MMLWASGSMHSPHHAPPTSTVESTAASSTWAGTRRASRSSRQKELGIVPPGTKLTERIDEIPAWDSLNDDEKKLYARQMEVFAAQMEHVDHQIGRVVETNSNRIGELDNTLIFVTADNGASGEGGLAGTFNETYVLNGLQTPFEANLRNLRQLGRRDTYPHYHAGWAMAGNTPFRYFKQSEHRGGQHDHLVVHWPNGIKAKGEVRNQYHHISDIAPTIMEAAGLEVPDDLPRHRAAADGRRVDELLVRRRMRPTARSVSTTRCSATARSGSTAGRRSRSTRIACPGTWPSVLPFEQDEWELYHVAEDFSESTNLAKENPEKLEELKKIFDEEAWKYNVYPLYDDMIQRMAKQQNRLFGDQTRVRLLRAGRRADRRESVGAGEEPLAHDRNDARSQGKARRGRHRGRRRHDGRLHHVHQGRSSVLRLQLPRRRVLHARPRRRYPTAKRI